MDRRLAIRGFVFAALLLALIPMAGPGPASVAAAARTPVRVIFDGSGTYTLDLSYNMDGVSCATHDDIILSWITTYETTIKDGVLQAAEGTTTGPASNPLKVGDMQFTITSGGLCAQFLVNCSSDLSIYAPTKPQLAVSGDDPQRVTAQALPPLQVVTAPGCLQEVQEPLAGIDLSLLASLPPDATTTVATIPKAKVAAGYRALVDSSAALDQAPGVCLGQVGDPRVVSCAQDLKWHGALQITCPASDEIGKVTEVTGEASVTQGSIACRGQTIKTGKNSHVYITFKDQAVLWIDPETEVDDLDEAKFLDESQRSLGDQFRLVIGRVGAAFSGKDASASTGHASLLCDPGCMFLPAGANGSELTASRDTPDGPLTVHVIAGQGFVQLPGQPRVTFPAGYTVVTDDKTYTLTTDWPAADQALVPSKMRPPSLTNVSLSGSGAALKVSLKLNTSAALVVTIKQGDKVLATTKANGKKGTNSLAPLKADLPPGSYTVVVSATKSKRVSIVELPLVAPGLATPVASPIATPGG